MEDREKVETRRSDPSASRATNSNNNEMERSARPLNRSSRQPQSAPNTTARDEEDEEELLYGAEHVIRLFVPVSICMAFVIASMKIIKIISEVPLHKMLYAPFESTSDDDTSTRVWSSLGNAAILICVIIVSTFGLVLLFKYKCYRFINGYLMMTSLLILTILSTIYVSFLIMAYNWCVSMPTVLFLMMNYSAMGMICIHWKGPLLMQQGYLISICALFALAFINLLPDWTVWPLLAMLVVWDLVAVLCPKGPLNMLMQMLQERNEPIPAALIYSSTAGILMLPHKMMMNMVAEGERKSEQEKEDTSPSTVRRERREEEGREAGGNRSRAGGDNNTQARQVAASEEEDQGPKLGLGDFIFYSVLVGKASLMDDWNTIVACYVAILLGLCSTVLMLAADKKALPALPISITAGLIFYFCTTLLITPFTTQLVTHQLTY